MKLECKWNDKMRFTAEVDHHQVEMDAKPPLGSDAGMTPKQLLLAGIAGCTGMDVVSLLKKYKLPLESLKIEVDATSTEGVCPPVYKDIKLIFKFEGKLDHDRVLESVKLSQTKYCGVSAMLSHAVPISYTVEVNGEEIGSGRAQFN